MERTVQRDRHFIPWSHYSSRWLRYIFKVNDHRLKIYFEPEKIEEIDVIEFHNISD
jgi:hypothetical protein